MKTTVRRRIAYLVARIGTNKQSGAVYDYQEGGYCHMSGQIGDSNISIYDYTSSSFISGTGNANRYNLYDYEDGGHISLEIQHGKFNGYDYGSGSHFNGNVTSSGEVSIFDFEHSEYYSYSI